MVVQSSSLGFGKDFAVKSTISVEDVDRYLVDDDCHALSQLEFEAHLVNRGKHIELEADIHVELEISCPRCGQSFTRSFEPHISLKLIDASSFGKVDEVVLEADDMDTITYEAPTIQLNDILLESVFLELDEHNLCSEDCKGICLNCGKNLNQGPCSCS